MEGTFDDVGVILQQRLDVGQIVFIKSTRAKAKEHLVPRL
jgi:hypothetical protein